jgi:TolB-like protein/Flp pilus assembly protein TadD
MIRTVPRRGLIFNSPVEDDGAPAAATVAAYPGGAEAGRRLRFSYIIMLLLVAASAAWWVYRSTRPMAPAATTASAHPKSVAVLPFVDMSEQENLEYFSEGISEEILNRLAQTPELQVIARTSSFSFKGENVDIAAIAGKLHVAHVLEGSVRKSGNRVRVTAQLVNASNSVRVWSQSYDREFDEIMAVQDEIAAAVADALHVVPISAPFTQGAAPMDVSAYERFLQAKFFHGRRGRGDLERAETYYREALKVSPGFARAWAGLAGVYVIRMDRQDLAAETGLAAMREAVERALLHGPGLAEAHVRAASYYWITGEVETAYEHHRTAQRLAPNDPLVLSSAAGTAASRGHLDEAIERQSRAVELDPLSFAARNNLAVFLEGAGRFGEAKAEYERALEINPDASEVEAEIAFILILQEHFEEALTALQRWPDGPDRDKGLALVGHSLGRQAEADEAIHRLTARAGPRAALYLAEVYAWRGEIDEAFEWVARSADEERSDRQMWSVDITDMQASPFLRPLRNDPRWSETLAIDEGPGDRHIQ